MPVILPLLFRFTQAQAQCVSRVGAAEPISAGDGGLGFLFVSFGIVTSWVVRAAPDLYR